MIENLKRIREPLAWAMIALVVANLGLGIAQLVLQLQQEVPVFEAFSAISGSLMNISLVIAVVALACLCFFIAPATPQPKPYAAANRLERPQKGAADKAVPGWWRRSPPQQ